MPLSLPANYIDVAYDPMQQQFTVWVIQGGHVTSSTMVRSSSTVAVIAKRLACPVHTDNLELTLALTQQGVAVIPHRFRR
jgi:hypothetical protein